MKRFLLFCLGLILVLPIFADEMYLSYCDGEVTNVTKSYSGKNKTVQVAIRVPAADVASLVGANITRVRVGVNTDCPKLPSNVTAWVRTSPSGPNLAEKKTSVQKGWNEIRFDTPLAIPAESDLWIGYSYLQASTSLKVVAFAGTPIDGCSFYYNNGTASGWNDKSLDADGALCVEAVVEGDNLPQHDLALTECFPDRNMVKLGTPIVVRGALRNSALATAQGFEIEYSVNDGQVTGTASFDDEVAYREYALFEFPIPTDGLAEGSADAKIEIRWKDGVADDYAADNAGSISVNLFEKGYARNVMLEEFTTEQCGWCPLGINYINQALDNYGSIRSSVVWVCHHAGFGTDFLTIPESNSYCALYGGNGTFAPAMMVDRTYEPRFSSDGVVGGATQAPIQTYSWLATNLDEPAFVNVEIVSATCLGDEVKICVRAEKYDAFDALTTSPYLNVWVTENHIPMRNQADNSGLKTGYHEHAIRKVLTATWGTAFTWVDGAYEAEFTCEKGSDWNAEMLNAVAFVSNYGSTIYERQVFNCNEKRISTTDEAGITHISADAAAQVRTYSVDGRQTTGNVPGIAIRRSIAADGAIRAEKVMVK